MKTRDEIAHVLEISDNYGAGEEPIGVSWDEGADLILLLLPWFAAQSYPNQALDGARVAIEEALK